MIDRNELRDAMRWYLAEHPGRVFRVISHPWYGHAIWEASSPGHYEPGVVMQTSKLIELYRASRC